MVKYPEISVQLSGEDGNAFAILARVRKALHKAKVSATEIELFTNEAKSGDYDHLLNVCIEWVDVG